MPFSMLYKKPNYTICITSAPTMPKKGDGRQSTINVGKSKPLFLFVGNDVALSKAANDAIISSVTTAAAAVSATAASSVPSYNAEFATLSPLLLQPGENSMSHSLFMRTSKVTGSLLVYVREFDSLEDVNFYNCKDDPGLLTVLSSCSSTIFCAVVRKVDPADIAGAGANLPRIRMPGTDAATSVDIGSIIVTQQADTGAWAVSDLNNAFADPKRVLRAICGLDASKEVRGFLAAATDVLMSGVGASPARFPELAAIAATLNSMDALLPSNAASISEAAKAWNMAVAVPFRTRSPGYSVTVVPDDATDAAVVTLKDTAAGTTSMYDSTSNSIQMFDTAVPLTVKKTPAVTSPAGVFQTPVAGTPTSPPPALKIPASASATTTRKQRAPGTPKTPVAESEKQLKQSNADLAALAEAAQTYAEGTAIGATAADHINFLTGHIQSLRLKITEVETRCETLFESAAEEEDELKQTSESLSASRRQVEELTRELNAARTTTSNERAAAATRDAKQQAEIADLHAQVTKVTEKAALDASNALQQHERAMQEITARHADQIAALNRDSAANLQREIEALTVKMNAERATALKSATDANDVLVRKLNDIRAERDARAAELATATSQNALFEAAALKMTDALADRQVEIDALKASIASAAAGVASAVTPDPTMAAQLANALKAVADKQAEIDTLNAAASVAPAATPDPALTKQLEEARNALTARDAEIAVLTSKLSASTSTAPSSVVPVEDLEKARRDFSELSAQCDSAKTSLESAGIGADSIVVMCVSAARGLAEMHDKNKTSDRMIQRLEKANEELERQLAAATTSGGTVSAGAAPVAAFTADFEQKVKDVGGPEQAAKDMEFAAQVRAVDVGGAKPYNADMALALPVLRRKAELDVVDTILGLTKADGTTRRYAGLSDAVAFLASVQDKDEANAKIAEMDKCVTLLGATAPADVYTFIAGLGDRTDAAARLDAMRQILALSNAAGPLFADGVAVLSLITGLGDITGALACVAEMRKILALADTSAPPPALLFANPAAVSAFITSLKDSVKTLLGTASMTVPTTYVPLVASDEAVVNAQNTAFSAKKAALSSSASFGAAATTRVTGDLYCPGSPLRLDTATPAVGAADLVAAGALGAFVEHLLEHKKTNPLLLSIMSPLQQQMAINLARLFALLPNSVLATMETSDPKDVAAIALGARGVLATLDDCGIPLIELPAVLSVVSALKYRLVGWMRPAVSPMNAVTSFVDQLLKQSASVDPTGTRPYWDEILATGTVTDLDKAVTEAIAIIVQSPVISSIAVPAGTTPATATRGEKNFTKAVTAVMNPVMFPGRGTPSWAEQTNAADTLMKVATGIYTLIAPIDVTTAPRRMDTFVGHMKDLISAVQYNGTPAQGLALTALVGHLTGLFPPGTSIASSKTDVDNAFGSIVGDKQTADAFRRYVLMLKTVSSTTNATVAAISAGAAPADPATFFRAGTPTAPTKVPTDSLSFAVVLASNFTAPATPQLGSVTAVSRILLDTNDDIVTELTTPGLPLSALRAFLATVDGGMSNEALGAVGNEWTKSAQVCDRLLSLVDSFSGTPAQMIASITEARVQRVLIALSVHRPRTRVELAGLFADSVSSWQMDPSATAVAHVAAMKALAAAPGTPMITEMTAALNGLRDAAVASATSAYNVYGLADPGLGGAIVPLNPVFTDLILPPITEAEVADIVTHVSFGSAEELRVIGEGIVTLLAGPRPVTGSFDAFNVMWNETALRIKQSLLAIKYSLLVDPANSSWMRTTSRSMYDSQLALVADYRTIAGGMPFLRRYLLGSLEATLHTGPVFDMWTQLAAVPPTNAARLALAAGPNSGWVQADTFAGDGVTVTDLMMEPVKLATLKVVNRAVGGGGGLLHRVILPFVSGMPAAIDPATTRVTDIDVAPFDHKFLPLPMLSVSAGGQLLRMDTLAFILHPSADFFDAFHAVTVERQMTQADVPTWAFCFDTNFESGPAAFVATCCKMVTVMTIRELVYFMTYCVTTPAAFAELLKHDLLATDHLLVWFCVALVTGQLPDAAAMNGKPARSYGVVGGQLVAQDLTRTIGYPGTLPVDRANNNAVRQHQVAIQLLFMLRSLSAIPIALKSMQTIQSVLATSNTELWLMPTSQRGNSTGDALKLLVQYSRANSGALGLKTEVNLTRLAKIATE